MLQNDRVEPYQDEYGGIWYFYKAIIPSTNFEYSYILRLPPEIHNYIIDRYVGTKEQGPLPEGFHFTPQMMEDITRQWVVMDGERPHDVVAFRAAIEETINHRYYIEDTEIPFDQLVEQQEHIVNEPFDLGQQEPETGYLELYGIFGTSISYQPGQQIKDDLGDVYEVTAVSTYNGKLGLYDTPAHLMQARPLDEQIAKAIDEGQLGEVTPEHGDDFMSQNLLEPVPLNFGQSVKGIADYLKERLDHFRETFDTFGR